jgi:hypothetical protein
VTKRDIAFATARALLWSTDGQTLGKRLSKNPASIRIATLFIKQQKISPKGSALIEIARMKAYCQGANN